MAIRGFALIAYFSFLAVFVYFIGFVSGFVVPKTVDDGAAGSPLLALGVNLALVAFFGVAHSVMARASFKRMWTRIVPPAAERSMYVLVASAQLALLMWQWRPIATPVLWSVDGAFGLALAGVGFVGWGLVLASSFMIDHFELFGLRQGFARPAPPTGLRTPLLYNVVRHPLYLGLLLGLWGCRSMTAGHLLLATLMTIYLLIGVHHEEKDLVRIFGDDYRRYQERVPMLLPFLRRRAAAAVAEGSLSK